MALPDNRIIHLKRETELQLIVYEPGDKVWLKLMEGSAEIFGSDLIIDREYGFSYFSSVAIFSWTGCTLKLWNYASKNICFNIRTSKEVFIMKDLHEQIEETRLNADAKTEDAPVILLVGPSDAGKSTMCRFLLNYAVKYGRQPTFVDLDVGQSSLSITGTFGVLPIHKQSNVNGTFNEDELSVYYFGYKSPGHNMTLYKLLLKKLGRSLKVRLKNSQMINSGVVIDTCGWVDGGGYKLVKDVIEMLEVNMVIVLSQASVYYKLKEDLDNKTKLTFVKKLKGVTTRNRNVRRVNRDNCVHQYFYGSYGQLKPYTIKVNFKELQIYKVDCSNYQNVIPVIIEPSILNQVLALSYTENTEKILFTSVYGFISIIELDMDLEIITVLSPQPGPLPTKYSIMGDITFVPEKELI